MAPREGPQPVRWAPGRLEEFKRYLHYELTLAMNARQNLERQWRIWLEQYRAPAKQPVKKFPYEGASNIVLPVIATTVDQLYSLFMQTIHTPDNLWTLEPLNERWVEAAKPLQDFLQLLARAPQLVDMYDVDKRVILEMTKLGTGVYKHGWLYEKRPIRTYDERGKIVTMDRLISRPFVDHVRLADLIMPPYSYNVQPDHQGGAPWIAERLRIHKDRLLSLAAADSPNLPNYDKAAIDLIIKFEQNAPTLYDEKVAELDYVKHARSNIDFDKSSDIDTSKGLGLGRTFLRQIELWEVHVRWPTGDGDSQDDLVVWYHIPTYQVVRAVYNWYLHGQRPYEVVRYFPGEGFYGIGVAEQMEMFQTLQTDLMNFSIDNVLLANSRMMVAKAGANIVPGEPIYPGKIFITDGDVRQEFGSFQMADIYQSLPLLQNTVQALGERRGGVSDIQLGNLQELPGRTPATTMLSLLQEGKRRPDLTLKGMRYEGLSKVGLRLLQLCQQYIGSPVETGAKRILELAVETLGMPEGQYAAQKLSTPLENAELGVGVSITATSMSANKEVEKQNYQALLQLAAQLSPQFIQLVQIAQQAQGTAVGQVATETAQGLQELYRRLLQQYDIRNLEQIVPEVPSEAQGQPGGNGAAGPVGGPGGGAPGAQFDPALARLFGAIGKPVGP